MSDFKTQSAGYLVNHLARLFAHRLHGAIAPLGLAPAQFMALIELWREEGLTQAELTQRLDVEQATMANTLARMERDGLIERRPHPGDKRARGVFLTERARALEAPAKSAARAVNDEALAPLEDAERARLLELVSRTIDHMRTPGRTP